MVRISLVSHGPSTQKIMDNPNDVVSSTIISTVATARSYSETTYHSIHDLITITDNLSQEPNEGGTISLGTEDLTSEYMLNWLQEVYEDFGRQSCYHTSIIYDEEEEIKDIFEDARS